MDLHNIREDYNKRELSEAECHADPIVQFEQWLNEAVAAQAAVRTIALPNVAPERLAVFRRQGVRNAALQLIKKAGESVDLCWRNAHGTSGE